MALLASELARIKYELGYNLLSISAIPYAWDGVTQIFEQVVQPYLMAGALAYSSTTVVAASTPTQVALTLTSAVGFSVGDAVSIDVDSKQEPSHVAVVSGSTITVPLLLAHSGTYPVTVDGGESIVRGILRQLFAVNGPDGLISQAALKAGIQNVDGPNGVTFFGSTTSQQGVFDSLMSQVRYLRNELSSALGVPNLREYDGRNGGGRLVESY